MEPENLPPPPRVSADGNFYWDGERWVPMQQPLPSPQAPNVVVTPPPPTNGLAITSLVFGIMSWIVCPLIGGTVAAACGQVARNQIQRTGENGAGLAIAGMVLGYLNLAAIAVIVVIEFVVLVITRH